MTLQGRISRRTVLKGMGAAVALPWLEAMSPMGALAATTAGEAPKRMAFLYVPNGVNMADWRPSAEGAAFDLPPTLQPLAEWKDDLMVLSGLTQDKARANGDGPGDHARSLATFLTGTQARKTHGADIQVGVSADQVAAEQIGHLTRLPSLEIGCEEGRQAGSCDSGYSCAYSSNISWKTESTPMAKEINPRLVFERLFGDAADGKTGEGRELRARYQKSVLDFVLDDASRLRASMGAADGRKLDEYLTSVRELEQRITRSEDEHAKNRPDFETPAGVPAEYADHLRLMCDLLALAFQTDTTRIATFVLANEGSNRSYPFIDVRDGHHNLSHHGRKPEKLAKISKINHFHTTQFAYLLGKLKSIQEGSGSLLDNCMIIYGSGLSDGNRHNHNDLPVLLAGKGGGTIQPGRHVQYADETPMTNLYLSMLDRMGVDAESIGDSTGRLDKLTA